MVIDPLQELWQDARPEFPFRKPDCPFPNRLSDCVSYCRLSTLPENGNQTHQSVVPGITCNSLLVDKGYPGKRSSPLAWQQFTCSPTTAWVPSEVFFECCSSTSNLCIRFNNSFSYRRTTNWNTSPVLLPQWMYGEPPHHLELVGLMYNFSPYVLKIPERNFYSFIIGSPNRFCLLLKYLKQLKITFQLSWCHYELGYL